MDWRSVPAVGHQRRDDVDDLRDTNAYDLIAASAC
jgi:hypothetical protein